MHYLRRLALKGTELERARCTTIRLKVLKIGAQIHVTVRRVWIRMAAGYPYKEAFQQAFDNLQQIPLRPQSTTKTRATPDMRMPNELCKRIPHYCCSP